MSFLSLFSKKKSSTSKNKSGFVYVGESTRKSGVKKLYVGKTNNVKRRWGEHIRASKGSSGKSWTSKGTHFKPLGAFYSANPSKAERTLKKKSPAHKRRVASYSASKYRSKTKKR